MTVAQEWLRPTVSFTEEDYEEFVRGGIGWKIVHDEVADHRRWSVTHEVILKRLEDDTFWLATYEVGATESQHYSWADKWPGGDGEGHAVFIQVFPKSVTTTVYE